MSPAISFVARCVLCWGVLFALAILQPGTLEAQTATGTYAYGTFESKGVDTINVGNLNVHLTVPILHKGGRGLPFNYDLVYDSSIWSPTTNGGTLAWIPTPLWGWKGDTDAVTGFINYTATTQTERYNGHTCTNTYYTNWTYIDNLGTAHLFYGESNTGTVGSETCPEGVPSFTETASDGSGFTIRVIGFHNATITTVQGKTITPPVSTASGGTVEDSNGNELSIDNSGDFTDTSGSVALSVNGIAPSPKTLAYHDASGVSRAVTVTYSTYTVQTSFGCTGITDYPATSTSLVNRITFPDSTYYAFTYEATPGNATNVTGRLASVTLPSGGVIRYAYTGATTGLSATMEVRLA